MKKLMGLLPTEQLEEYIKEARGIPVNKKQFTGLLNPDTSKEYLFQIVVESTVKRFGISFTNKGYNIFSDDQTNFKIHEDLAEKSSSYSTLREKIISKYSDNDLELIGRALKTEAVRYMAQNYTKEFRFLADECKMIAKKEAPAIDPQTGLPYMRQLTLEIGYNASEKKFELFYNPIFIARGCMEEVFGEIMELPDTANFENFDTTYLYDWMINISCFYIMHEIFHAINGEVKTFQEDSRELSFLDARAKNIINDFHINNTLQEMFRNNPYIIKIFSDVLGVPDRGINIKSVIADHFYFQGFPSENIGVDTNDPAPFPKKFPEIGSALAQVINKNLMSTNVADGFEFKPSTLESEDFSLPLTDNYKVAFCGNVSARKDGIEEPMEFYGICRDLVKFMFGQPPKAKTSSVTATIDDEISDSDIEVEDVESIFCPIPMGSIVKVNSSGEVGVVHTVHRDEDGNWTFKVFKVEKSITEAREKIVPKGWSVVEEPIGDFTEGELTVLEYPQERTGESKKSDQKQGEQGEQGGQPQQGSGGEQGEQGEQGQQPPQDSRSSGEQGEQGDDQEGEESGGGSSGGEEGEEEGGSGETGTQDGGETKDDSSDDSSGKGQNRDLKVGDEVEIVGTSLTGIIRRVNPDGTYEVEQTLEQGLSETMSLITEKRVPTGKSLGNFSADSLSPIQKGSKDDFEKDGKDDGKGGKEGDYEVVNKDKPSDGDAKDPHDKGIKYKNKDEEREAHKKLSDLAQKYKKDLGSSSTVLDKVADPMADLKQRFADQSMSLWRQKLTKMIRRAVGINIIQDLDAPNRRIPNEVTDEYVEITLEDICLIFDVSGSMNIERNYGIILRFLDSMFKMNGMKFKKIAFSYFGADYSCSKPMAMGGAKILSQVLAQLKKNPVNEAGTDPSMVLMPFDMGGDWKVMKPSIVVVFTDGNFFGGRITPGQHAFIKGRYGKNIIIVLVPGQDGMATIAEVQNIFKLPIDDALGEPNILRVQSKA